jgi:hypothetical protein
MRTHILHHKDTYIVVYGHTYKGMGLAFGDTHIHTHIHTHARARAHTHTHIAFFAPQVSLY